MKRIDAEYAGNKYTFRTNNDGSYLFVGVGENRQISCESGFDSLRRIKRAISDHIKGDRENREWLQAGRVNMGVAEPRIKYHIPDPTVWKS